MAGEPLRGFPKKVQKALRDGKADYALRLFQDQKYEAEIRDKAWDLIPVVTEFLTQPLAENFMEFFKGCKELLDIIVEKSNPEDVLLQLVSEIEGTCDNRKFITLVCSLGQVVGRVTKNKATSLAWVFNAIQSYLVKTCKIPDHTEMDLTGKERMLLDNTDKMYNIYMLFLEVLDFYDICLRNVNLDNEIKGVMCKFLVQLLGPPLGAYNMEIIDDYTSEGFQIAEKIIEKVFLVLSDPLALVRNQSEYDSCTTPSPISIANLFYVVYCEGVCYDLVPKVYQHVYLLQSCMMLINALFEVCQHISTEKALRLCNHFMVYVPQGSLSYLLLDDPVCCQLLKLLNTVIIYDNKKLFRKAALGVLNRFIGLFENRGIYQLILNVFTRLPHSGLKGYLITIYKDFIDQDLNQDLSLYCKGPKLSILLEQFSKLNQGEQTDLMENSDQIISALNFIRFLALRDPTNRTNFWDFIPMLKNKFLDPLRRGLELSQAHYKLEVKQAEEALSKGLTYDFMPLEDKLISLHSCLTAFDVIESLLSRVFELLEHKPV